MARLQSRLDLCRRAVADHRHRAYGGLQAGDLADLGLHDHSGAHHSGVGVLRGGDAQGREKMSARSANLILKTLQSTAEA